MGGKRISEENFWIIFLLVYLNFAPNEIRILGGLFLGQENKFFGFWGKGFREKDAFFPNRIAVLVYLVP